MTYPNPAGYYSLNMPASIEEEITSLDYFQLTHLLYSLSYSACPGHLDSERPSLSQLTDRAIKWIEEVERVDLIALIRWVAERLDYVATVSRRKLAKETDHA